MIKKQFVNLILTAFIFVQFGLNIHAANVSSPPDTTSVTHFMPVIHPDSTNIGPEFRVTGKSLLGGDENLPSFCEVLIQFITPVKGKVISRYGIRHGRMHTGTDIKLYLGDTVYAAATGMISRASVYYGYGKLVVVNHLHSLETYYAHLSDFLVKPGELVKKGQPIGLGGRTGRATTEHLHFEIRENGKAYNPELVYNFEDYSIRPEIEGKHMLAELTKKTNQIAAANAEKKAEAKTQKISASSVKQGIEDFAALPVEYVIKGGDSLWEIAKKFQTSVSSLCELNNLSKQSVLRVGTKIKVLN